MTHWRISPLRACEISQYLALLQRFREEEGLPRTSLGVSQIANNVFSRNRRVAIHVARIRADIIGFVSFRKFYEPSAGVSGIHLCDIYVDPAYRRRGVSRQLFQSCKRAGLLTKVTFIWWVTNICNTRAMNLALAVGATSSTVNSVLLKIP